MDDIDLECSIVAIVSLDKEGAVAGFLGTGVFCGRPALLLTANHVLEDAARIGIRVASRKGASTFEARVVLREPGYDIAALVVDGYHPKHPLNIARPLETLSVEDLVSCFEYGTTERTEGGLRFNPALRKGNITRFVEVAHHAPRAQPLLELSFPALKGASGAPVFWDDELLSLAGIVIANVARELLPMQISTVYDDKGKVEERIVFMMPAGLAVGVDHVRHVYERALQLLSGDGLLTAPPPYAAKA